MPKIKTKEQPAKRFSTTGTGKLKRNKSSQEPYLNQEDN